MEEMEEDKNGAPKRTGRLRLRYDGDENTVTLKGKTYTKVQKEAMEGKEEDEVILDLPTGKYPFTGRSFVLGFAIPNFFFHVTMAYALLRHRGVPLGKLDYLGGL